VNAGSEADFEAHYGLDGVWAKLFAASRFYLGTELFRDARNAGVYLTLDRWRSDSDFEAFKSENGEACQALDARCEPLTAAERRLGAFLSST